MSNATGPSQDRPARHTVESIIEGEAKWDRISREQQRKTARFAILATVLSPIAVFFVSIQIIFLHGAWWLTLFELCVLFFVLIMGYVGFGPNPEGWAGARIRAEVLRRERFLLAARLGPYLDVQEPSGEIGRRLQAIELEDGNPILLLHLADARGRWRDQFEDAHHMRHAEVDLLGCIRDYAENRIVDQQSFYRKSTHKHHHLHTRFETLAKIGLAFAIVFSGVHLAIELLGGHAEDGLTAQFFTFGSLLLPPVMAAFAGMQSFYQPNRLRMSYQRQSEVLGSFANELSRLEDKVVAQKQPLDPTVEGRLFREFKRIVLHAEEVMANEQMQWWMLINSWTPST